MVGEDTNPLHQELFLGYDDNDKDGGDVFRQTDSTPRDGNGHKTSPLTVVYVN